MKQLDWQDRPMRALLRLAWPIVASTVSYNIMTLTDTAILGRVGRAQLAGVGFAGTIAFALLCFSIGLLQGARTLVAQAVGARRNDEARSCFGAAVFSALVLGVLTIGLGLVAAEVIGRFTSSVGAAKAAGDYLRIRTLAAPMALLFAALRESSYAHGNSRAPMLASLAANAVNVVLALWFVLGLRAGAAGAAWATVVAHTVEAGVLGSIMWLQRLRPALPRRGHLLALARIGTPTGIQFTLEVGAFSILSALISMMSETDMAAHQIALQVIHCSFMPIVALGEAASVLAGHAVGADRDELAMRVAHLTLRVAVVYTAICGVLLVAGAGWLAHAFRADPEVTRIAVRLFYIAAAFEILDGAQIVARSILQGVGDVKYAAVVGVLASWMCTPPFTWLLGRQLGLGAAGGWLAISMEILTCTIVMWLRVGRRGWRAAAARARARLREETDDLSAA